MNLTYTDSRDPSLLHPELQKRLNLLFAAYLAKYPNAPQPKIAQTTRSAREQTEDYAKGRTTPGPIITNAKAGQSLHNYQPGLAFDVFFEVDGKYSTDESLYANLGALAPSVDLNWGGSWIHSKDTPHFQPLNGGTLYTWEDAQANIEPLWGEIVPPAQSKPPQNEEIAVCEDTVDDKSDT